MKPFPNKKTKTTDNSNKNVKNLTQKHNKNDKNLPHNNNFKKPMDDHTTKYPVFARKHTNLMKNFKFETIYCSLLFYLIYKHVFDLCIKHMAYFIWDLDTYIKPEYLLVSIYGLFQAIILINNLVSLFYEADCWIKSRLVIGTQFVMLGLFGVNKLICPFDKCETQALQAQVLNLVGVELFNRYDGLLLKESLNMMSDIVYCPRVNCQSPVIPEDTLAQCNAIGCNYVFCALCRQGYHGIETCKITNVEMKRICVEYTTGDAEMQKFLHKKYGEKRIKLAIEETYSMDLIRNTSKQCPKCKSWMQKLDGCNKMACVRCHCYFCWLCFCILSKNDPYSHFNSKNSECFEKLFEGAWNLDNDEDDEENNRELLGEFGDLNLEDEGLDDLEDDDGIVFAR